MTETTTTIVMCGTRSEDFFGRQVTFHEAADASQWVTAEQAAPMLGLGSSRAVRKLFSENKADFVGGCDFVVTKLRVACSGNQGFREQNVLCFSLTGLELLALLVKNEVGRRARRWVVDLREKGRRGQVAMITVEQFKNIQSGMAAAVEQVKFLMGMVKTQGDLMVEQQRTNVGMTKIVEAQIEHAGRVLAYAKHYPLPEEEQRRALELELKERQKGQQFLTPPPSRFDMQNGGN